MNKRRVKRCKVCLKKLKDNKTCTNLEGCPLARKQKQIAELEK